MLHAVLIIRLALLYGAVLSVALGSLIYFSVRHNAEMWLNDYPPDVRKQFGAMGSTARRQRWMVAALFLLVVFAVVAAAVVHLAFATAGQFSFFSLFVLFAITFTLFNLTDLLILDWLIFVAIQPRWVILPGTDGMKGYRDYWFHLRAFLVGAILTLVVSAVLASLIILARWLIK